MSFICGNCDRFLAIDAPAFTCPYHLYPRVTKDTPACEDYYVPAGMLAHWANNGTRYLKRNKDDR